MAIDRHAYFSRIGYAARADATLDTLRDVVAAHNRSIPFEHNGLLGYVLDDLGFDVQRLAGRVVWMRQNDALPAQTHQVLSALLPDGDGPYLVDVGFGGQTLRSNDLPGELLRF